MESATPPTAAAGREDGHGSVVAAPWCWKNTRMESMKSTWRTQNRSGWTLYHWFYELLNIHSTELGRPVPVHRKQAAVPYLSNWTFLGFIMIHGMAPMTVQHLYTAWNGNSLGFWEAMVLYNLCMALTAIRGQHILRNLGHQLGFFDGEDFRRQSVPDTGIQRAFVGINAMLTGRSSLLVLLAYSNSHAPADVAWHWLPFKMVIYTMVLDTWFYWSHRAMHQIPCLRRHHKRHHQAHHPESLLSGFADYEQMMMEFVLFPAMCYYTINNIGLSLSFYEWWVCNLQVFLAETGGHSGVRMHASIPSIFDPIFRLLGCDHCIEDHDIHHRAGWKDSGNFGSQTGIWDALCGTRKERIEGKSGNIDWNNPVKWPLV
ncbi:hypothetical protein BBAD15_g10641 [Beauveria bassiana D1-5]|uniref:Fatty acid hydroxylase domain-containing protein n=2 Tax=Beauveria bassiana TaxID=176275 RepID=A0A0A2VDD9_BEABA|nr:hypothetical protein BBAD15_g10641 [Beauveria bassiana D1-5]